MLMGNHHPSPTAAGLQPGKDFWLPVRFPNQLCIVVSLEMILRTYFQLKSTSPPVVVAEPMKHLLVKKAYQYIIEIIPVMVCYF